MKLDKTAPISKIMSSTVVSVTATHRIREARELFERCSLHHLPVIDDERRLVGIISHTDLYRLGFDGTFPEDAGAPAPDRDALPVSRIMRKDPITVGRNDPTELALAILAEGTFHSLPVVDEEDRLVGILTTSDVLRRLLES